ncbi:E3 ubiquitin-protein ligase BIG BROTHER-like isoform X2 [Benincasa hispida]|uniref:E3 ubiquitin-protein ligase BIG BROTHER-like isoform X2 n=1 Tax=Benincasa hispida TaxID=102211 RepID=UPI001901A850|nr:E3 ubiquitin-protein ligase BIG BROTHER-like isoform X2 [Benincasa hispida]
MYVLHQQLQNVEGIREFNSEEYLSDSVVYEMSWNNTQTEVHHVNTNYPYNTAGSFLEYFEGLTYEHVNFIFSGASHSQENVYPPLNSNFYKFGFSDFGSPAYYNQPQAYRMHDHEPIIYEHRRLESSATQPNLQSTINPEFEEITNTIAFDNHVECPRRHHNSHDFQVVWQDNVDPDNMTYEELLELGETVGTQSRGLSQELIALLPISKYKYSFFSRKKSRGERCVICQMEYKRGDRRITLPCKHIYHAGCGTKWLSINKACPICYTEVFGDTSKR